MPFYFCPRSVMLYIISRTNHPNLAYRGGQGPIVHLEADLRSAVAWAERQGPRWAFTLSNAGSYYFEDRCNLDHLNEVNWTAVAATWWQGELEEGKQAEFLIEGSFPWSLVTRVGVKSPSIQNQAEAIIAGAAHQPPVQVKPTWYY